MRKIAGICLIFVLGFSVAQAGTAPLEKDVLLKQAQEIARTISPAKYHPAVLSELAAAYLAKKDNSKADVLFNEALALMQVDEKTYKASYIYVIINLARAGRIDEALNLIKKSGEPLSNAGVTYLLMEGSENLDKSRMLELSDMITDPKYKVGVLGLIANKVSRAGGKKEAQKYYDQMLHLPGKVPDKYRDLAYCNAARSLFTGGEWKRALKLEEKITAPLCKATLFSYLLGQTRSFVNPLKKRKKRNQLIEIIRAQDYTRPDFYALYNMPYQLAKSGNLELAVEFVQMQKGASIQDLAYFRIVNALIEDGNIKEAAQIASLINDKFFMAMSFIKVLILQDTENISLEIQKNVADAMMRLARKEALCKACVSDQRKVFLANGMFVLENTSSQTRSFKVNFSYYRDKTKNYSQTYTLKPSEQVALTTSIINYNNQLKEIEVE